MSGKGLAFRIDVILQSVNELRQEKSALEQRYIDEKNRNKNLEMKLDQDTTRFNQSRERNAKMHETVKLAEQKVYQTESQTDRLTEINDAKQKVIAELNEKIKMEMDKQDCDVANFELKLLELTQLFRNAKQVYAKENLSQEIKEWKKNMDVFVTEADKKKIELEDLTKAFESLSVDNNKVKVLVGEKIGHKDLTYKDLQVVIDLLTRKHEQLNSFLDWSKSCLTTAHERLQGSQRMETLTKQAMLNDEPEMDEQMSGYHFSAQEQDSGMDAQSMFRLESQSTYFVSNNEQGTPMLYSEQGNHCANAPSNQQGKSMLSGVPAVQSPIFTSNNQQASFYVESENQCANFQSSYHQNRFDAQPANQPKNVAPISHHPPSNHGDSSVFYDYPGHQSNYVSPSRHVTTQIFCTEQEKQCTSELANDHCENSLFRTEPENQSANIPPSNHEKRPTLSSEQVNQSTNSHQRTPMSRSPFFISLPFFNSR